jgi:hypothetical protein
MMENALPRSIRARAVPMKLLVSSQSAAASGSDSISGPGTRGRSHNSDRPEPSELFLEASVLRAVGRSVILDRGAFCGRGAGAAELVGTRGFQSLSGAPDTAAIV